MGHLTSLAIMALIASTAGAPAPQFLGALLPSLFPPRSDPGFEAGSFYPPCPEPELPERYLPDPEPCIPPCKEPCIPNVPLPGPPQPCDPSLPPPTPNGSGPVGVITPKSYIEEKLRSVNFRAVEVPGGTFYVQHSAPVVIQPPPILVRPKPLGPIAPPPIVVQPQQQSPIVPPQIVVRPSPLQPIDPPVICVRPPRAGPIQPDAVLVRSPRPAPIQPPPITVTQPQPAPINPPAFLVRRPTRPPVQLPKICIPTTAVHKTGLSSSYPRVRLEPSSSPCSVPGPGPCPYCTSPCSYEAS